MGNDDKCYMMKEQLDDGRTPPVLGNCDDDTSKFKLCICTEAVHSNENDPLHPFCQGKKVCSALDNVLRRCETTREVLGIDANENHWKLVYLLEQDKCGQLDASNCVSGSQVGTKSA